MTDFFLVKSKIGTQFLEQTPFLEIESCFEPCVDFKIVKEQQQEISCYKNCVTKLLDMNNSFQLKTQMFSRMRNEAFSLRTQKEQQFGQGKKKEEK